MFSSVIRIVLFPLSNVVWNKIYKKRISQNPFEFFPLIFVSRNCFSLNYYASNNDHELISWYSLFDCINNFSPHQCLLGIPTYQYFFIFLNIHPKNAVKIIESNHIFFLLETFMIQFTFFCNCSKIQIAVSCEHHWGFQLLCEHSLAFVHGKIQI